MNCARFPKLMSNRSLISALLIFSLASLNGCYLSSSGKEMERRVLKVEEQQAEFMSTFARTRDELTKLVSQADQQVASLRETLEEARKMLGNSSATLGVRVDEVEQKISTLQGQLDAAEFNSKELHEALETLETDFEFRLEQLER